MNKSTIAAFLALSFSGTSLADGSMVGIWQCTMVSEYGEFEFILALDDDSTYVNKQNMFGDITVGTGKWGIEGTELVMKREKYTKKGKEKASSQEFRRNIVSVSNTALELKHDETTTTCTRT